jgi:hypothetical protein
MPTSPEQVRTGLQLVTAAAISEVADVAGSYSDPAAKVTALFASTPLVIADYLDGSSALALDWYDELRDDSGPSSVFTSSPVTVLREAEIGNTVAWATQGLREAETQALVDIDALAQKMLDDLAPFVQREVAAGFWDTITDNTKDDPDAVGWRRVARSGACPFCRMLADKGAVYRAESTAHFAAHKSCHCGAEPKFRNGDYGPEATAMQYMASKKRRSAADKARLRDYLKANYGA